MSKVTAKVTQKSSLSLRPTRRLDTDWVFPACQRLTATEERALALRIESGDQAAREELICRNLELVGWIVARVHRGPLSADEAMSAGAIGLVNAADGFRADRAIRFSTYATHAVRNAISSAVRAGVSAGVGVSAATLRRARADANGRANVGIGTSGAAGIDTEAEAEADADAFAPALAFFDLACLSSSDPDSIDEQETAAHVQRDREELHRAVATLPKREADVIRMRYGLDGQRPLRMYEIAERLGMTRQGIGFVERRAMDRLREKMGA